MLNHCAHLTNFWLFLRVGEFCLFFVNLQNFSKLHMKQLSFGSKIGDQAIVYSLVQTPNISVIIIIGADAVIAQKNLKSCPESNNAVP